MAIVMPIVDEEKCDGCGLCLEVCHASCFAIIDNVATGVKTGHCDYGGGCEAICPKQAISLVYEVVFKEGLHSPDKS